MTVVNALDTRQNNRQTDMKHKAKHTLQLYYQALMHRH